MPLGRAAAVPVCGSELCPAKALTDGGCYAAGGALAAVKPKRPFVQLAVAAAITDQHGRLLLSRRRRHMRSFPRAWVLPGGGVEPGDASLEAALRREVAEEVGLDLFAPEQPGGGADPPRPG